MGVGSALRVALIAAGLSLAALPQAVAQSYPNKPVHLIITTGPGSFVDIIARVLSTRMPESLGQPVVPENKPGAAGQIAADFVARLNGEVRKAYDKPEVIEALKRAAIDPLLMSPQDTAKFLRTEYQKWGKLIQQVGLKPQQ
jgi:tripartite-type tricarboxylate transporter receptor subunit TctC